MRRLEECVDTCTGLVAVVFSVVIFDDVVDVDSIDPPSVRDLVSGWLSGSQW